MQGKVNIFLTIYFMVTLVVLGIFTLCWGLGIFISAMGFVVYMILEPIFITIEIMLGLIMVLLSIFSRKFRDLKRFIQYLPWIVLIILTFPLWGRKIGLYIGQFIFYIYPLFLTLFLIYNILYFLREKKLVKSGEKHFIGQKISL